MTITPDPGYDLGALADAGTLGAAPICKCGCGEPLPEGSKRQFKRGHKSAADRAPTITSPASPVPGPSYGEVAGMVEDDPAPADMAEDAPKIPTIRITKRVKDDIEGKLAMIYGMLTLTVQLKDDVCGSALEANSEQICAKMVPIICKSPALVRWFTAGSGYMVWFELVMVFWPVLTVVAQHHITHSVGEPTSHDGRDVNGRVPNQSVYTA